ncbi:MAG: Ku protein [Phycisphaerales bacterium]|nr:Ku protein [Phycisphaerales bacterium]
MAPRAMWTGQLRLSLVSFGVRLYAATESAGRVSMNQLHRDCHQRVRNQLVCPVHGPINRDELVKGYEYEKDTYVIIEPTDLEAIRLPSSKTIELIQFVDESEIDPQYVDSPYFLGPDGPVAEEAYRVIREAMRRTKRIGIGKVVLYGREHIVALQVSGKGFLLATLRYASEVRDGAQFFTDVKDEPVQDEQLQLAETIMRGKAGAFDPSAYSDAYAEKFFDVVKAKIQGEALVTVEEEETPRAFNFMQALRQSVEQADLGADAKATEKKAKTPRKKAATKKPAAKSVSATRKKKSRKGA